MVLRLYNSLTRKKEDFVPLDRANVRMYVCGPTVYDHAHIGNARPVIVFDVLYRLLRHIYGEAHVKYVRNITDVDDKIMERAAAEGVSIDELTGRTTDQYHADVAALGCLPPDIEPRATEHVGEMKALIRTLIDKGHAYEAEGHVLFSVDAWNAYGELSGRSTDEMIAGARVEVAPYKKNPMDFVLWKPSAADQPGWDSDWGRGRPGWHIECSAMAEKHLGQVFDIHGGGVDLKFPHHENEIAQSRCAFGTGAMAKVWMHNGYLQVEGEKMSKSLGNFVTIRDLLDKWPGEVLRFNMLRTHYRQPIDWTEAGIRECAGTLLTWKEKLLNGGMDFSQQANREFYEKYPVSAAVEGALSEDLNTPAAITELHRISKLDPNRDPEGFQTFYGSLRFLGILDAGEMRRFQHEDEPTIDDPVAVDLLRQRDEARRQKDWKNADRIRDDLFERGYQIIDGPDGSMLELTR